MDLALVSLVLAIVIDAVNCLQFTCNDVQCGDALRNQVCKVNFKDPKLNVCDDFQSCYSQCSDAKDLTCGCSYKGDDLTLEKWEEEIAQRLEPLPCHSSKYDKTVKCAQTKSHASRCFVQETDDDTDVTGCVNEFEYCKELECCCEEPSCNIDAVACEESLMSAVRLGDDSEDPRERWGGGGGGNNWQEYGKSWQNKYNGDHHHHHHHHGDYSDSDSASKPYAAVAVAFIAGVFGFLFLVAFAF